MEIFSPLPTKIWVRMMLPCWHTPLVSSLVTWQFHEHPEELSSGLVLHISSFLGLLLTVPAPTPGSCEEELEVAAKTGGKLGITFSFPVLQSGLLIIISALPVWYEGPSPHSQI